MKKILLIHSGRAYLPEVKAYQEYFSVRGGFEVYDSKEVREFSLGDFDIFWHFMGLNFRKHDIFTVHEYQSLSCGQLASLKDFIKRKCNSTPNLRVFQNEHIMEKLNFHDHVLFCFRDMGVHDRFFDQRGKKEYDFVYLGNVSKERKTERLLRKFKTDLRDRTLLVIGGVPPAVHKEYSSVPNILFTGSMDYYDVPKYAVRACYGINYVENRLPYSMQTATKVLEYCALGLPVITTSYPWVNWFERRHGARFYKVDENLENLLVRDIEAYPFRIPDVEVYRWRSVIERAGLYDVLAKAL